MRRARVAASITALAMLAACTAPSQPFLDAARSHCFQGHQPACDRLPYLEAVVQREKNEQAEKAAAGFAVGLGVLAVGAAAGYAASRPYYYEPYYRPRTVVVVCNSPWGC